MINNKFGLLSGNILKIFGCIAMFIDHLGFLVFPNIQILRIIGRLSYPIFAFMLAEGCFYTKNRFRHFYVISLFGIVFQIVYYLVMEYIDLSIFNFSAFALTKSKAIEADSFITSPSLPVKINPPFPAK